MLGKSLSATGRRSSMNGTMRKTEKGMSRSRSVVVRLSYTRTSALVRGRQRQGEETHLTVFTTSELFSDNQPSNQTRRNPDLFSQ